MMDKIIAELEALGFAFEGNDWRKETEQCTLIADVIRPVLQYEIILYARRTGEIDDVCISVADMKKTKKIVKLLSDD
jgi:2-C-methyl-D-erythritol 4-phosphate cytidylyltransferase